MIEGKCPKCGQQYWGWSLLNHRNQSCKKCGTGLLISEDGKEFVEYKLKTPSRTSPEPEKDKSAK